MGGHNIYIPSSLLTAIHFGLLYNAYAVNDARNVANTGWRVSLRADWQTLETYCGGASVAGGKLKIVDSNYWDSPNTGATNEYGFNAKGCGVRRESFQQIQQTDKPWCEYLFTGRNREQQIFYNSAATVLASANAEYGQSIRLIKESTALSHGETSTYTGNDGREYPTICIGNQEWLAQPVAETKYRNGDSIPEVTDQATWDALTSGALCAYDNDLSNV